MQYTGISEIVKDLSFGEEAQSKIKSGVDKLANAVKSTLGASGKCVIYEDSTGRPVITKDGVTVAQSVVLIDPVENIGATLIKEAANDTVAEAGDGTTTATVLAHALLNNAMDSLNQGAQLREIQSGIDSYHKKVVEYLDKEKKVVQGDSLVQVAAISCNNDAELGGIIAEAYSKVGKDGVVFMEESETNETYASFIDGAMIDSGLKSPYFVTDKDNNTAVLDNPYVLLLLSPVTNLRKILTVVEHAIKKDRPLLIIGNVEQQPFQTLLANKVKGNMKVNIVDVPGFGSNRHDFMQDLAVYTGATVINEEMGDDLDLIEPGVLGECAKAVTDAKTTVLQGSGMQENINERMDAIREQVANEPNKFLKSKLEQRLAVLSGVIGIVKVGANSKVELQEKKDRVDDAIHATRAALQEGVIPGGGVALYNASTKLTAKNVGEEILQKTLSAPITTILSNAHIYEIPSGLAKGWGVDVTTGKTANMMKVGVIDPVLVTKSALKNAISVVKTIISADCIISNQRISNDASIR